MKFSNTWFAGLFKDEKGNPSSKRFIGIICGLSLCASLYFKNLDPSPTIVNAVSLLAFGCLGLTAIDKFTNRNSETKTEE
jgi:hypothetical protein